MWSFDAVPLVPQMGASSADADAGFGFDHSFHSLGYAAPQDAKPERRLPEHGAAPAHAAAVAVREEKAPSPTRDFVPVPLPADAKDLDDLEALCASMSDRRMSIGEADFVASFSASAGAGAGELPAFSASLAADPLSYHALEQTLACPLALTIATEMGGADPHKAKRPSLSDLYMDRDIEAARAVMDEEEEQRDTASDASNSEHGGNEYTDDDDDDNNDGIYEGDGGHAAAHHHHHRHDGGGGGKRNPSIRRSARSTRTRATNARRTSRQGASSNGAQKLGRLAASGGGGGGGAPTLPIPQNGVLSTDHVIARGRRRRIQLSKMTKAQIAIETEARMEKNRQLARDCRRRKKMKINTLEEKVTEYEDTIGKQDAQITRLEAEVAKLRAMLRRQ